MNVSLIYMCLPMVKFRWTHTQGLSSLPGYFTSRLLQDSLKERLWTRYQQITDRGTGPWPLGDPTMGALFTLTGLGSSTTEECTDAWGEEREKTDREGRTETQRLSRWNTGMQWQGKHGGRPQCVQAKLWRGRGYRGRAEVDQGKTGSILCEIRTFSKSTYCSLSLFL